VTERSFYITDFTDEVMPCEATLEGWAEWLATPDGDDEDDGYFRHGPISDGQSFAASAIAWKPDIVATRNADGWTLSRDPEETDFIAVRYGEGTGWSADNIPTPELGNDPATGEYTWLGTARDHLLKWLADNDEFCDDVEFVACGVNEDSWRLTFHVGAPARCEAVRTS
jgi:hypothetical protein